VRGIEILQNQLDASLEHVHIQRRAAVWRAVSGLLLGGRLWLTALGRALPGQTADKHRIKAADRLLGNRKLHGELLCFYRALAHRLLRRIATPVVSVDWSTVGSQHYMLSAQLCCDGRTLPLYSRVHPKSELGNARAQRQFLYRLASLLPDGCVPIIVTDAGFRSPWFDTLRSLGWHFVGRVRNRTKVLVKGNWADVRSLHGLACSRPLDMGLLSMRTKHSRSYRIVISKKPKLKGRKRINSLGRPGRKKVDLQSSKSAREPWILATSLECNVAAVVEIYSLRMQIEQSFRDCKSHRHGWALHHANSRSRDRLEVLLLLGALASVVTQTVGRAAARTGLHKLFQANTVSNRRVLSFFVLGLMVIRRRHVIARSALIDCLNEAVVIMRNLAPS